MRAVSNSSPLIALEKIHKLELLRDLFSTVTVPPAVALETAPTVKLPSWIEVYPLTSMVDSRTVRSTFGPGESEAISLSLELRPDRVILLRRASQTPCAEFGLERNRHTGTLTQCEAARPNTWTSTADGRAHGHRILYCARAVRSSSGSRWRKILNNKLETQLCGGRYLQKLHHQDLQRIRPMLG